METAIQITDAFITFTIWSSIGFFGAAFIYHAMFGFELDDQTTPVTPTVSGDSNAWAEVEAETDALMLGAGKDAADIDELLSIESEPRKVDLRGYGIRDMKLVASVSGFKNWNRLRKHELAIALGG